METNLETVKYVYEIKDKIYAVFIKDCMREGGKRRENARV